MTQSDMYGPAGPYLLEVNVGNPAAPGERRWVLQQSVGTPEEGLAVASRMAPCYEFRLYLAPEWGYLYLDWVDDVGGETCSPVWVRRD